MNKVKTPKGKYVSVYMEGKGAAAVKAEVVDLLNSQFTCRWTDGTDTLSFLFYADKGFTWEDYE